MITPLDCVCMQIIVAERRVDEAHYHLNDAALQRPRHIMDEANFHLINRQIKMKQIGFDYYNNIVTYRI